MKEFCLQVKANIWPCFYENIRSTAGRGKDRELNHSPIRLDHLLVDRLFLFEGLGFGVWSSGFGVPGSGFGV